MKADRLAAALRDDTALLTALVNWLRAELNEREEHAARADDLRDIYRWQGEARAIRQLTEKLQDMARLRKDGADDKSANGRN
jgi:hypothetical protein